jgi:hypothetical protein
MGRFAQSTKPTSPTYMHTFHFHSIYPSSPSTRTFISRFSRSEESVSQSVISKRSFGLVFRSRLFSFRYPNEKKIIKFKAALKQEIYVPKKNPYSVKNIEIPERLEKCQNQLDNKT